MTNIFRELLRQASICITQNPVHVVVDGRIRQMTTHLQICPSTNGQGFQFVDLDYGIVYPKVYSSIDEAADEMSKYVFVNEQE